MSSSTLEHTASHHEAKETKGLSEYRPLIFSVIIALILSYGLEILRSKNGMVPFHQAMNAFMGLFFIVFAAPKFISISGFAESFKQYDILSKRFPIYAKAYPFIELALGLALLTSWSYMSRSGDLIVNSLVALITVITMYGVAQALRRGKHFTCACLGSIFNFPLSKVALIENGLMFVMAIAMIIFYSSQMTMISLTHLGMLIR
jgi:hypothetical protein